MEPITRDPNAVAAQVSTHKVSVMHTLVDSITIKTALIGLSHNGNSGLDVPKLHDVKLLDTVYLS